MANIILTIKFYTDIAVFYDNWGQLLFQTASARSVNIANCQSGHLFFKEREMGQLLLLPLWKGIVHFSQFLTFVRAQ